MDKPSFSSILKIKHRDRPIVVQIIVIETPLLIVDVTRADLKQCGKMLVARDELNRSVSEGRVEYRHSIKSLEGMGSSSHDLVADIRIYSSSVNCDTFSNEEIVAVVVPVPSVEVIFSEAMLALCFSTLLVKCLMKRLGRSALV